MYELVLTQSASLPGRALLRLREHHLVLLGVDAEEQQQEILQDVFLLRVQEEVNDLTVICSGERMHGSAGTHLSLGLILCYTMGLCGCLRVD